MSVNKLTDEELLTLVMGADSDAAGYASELKADNDYILDFYNGAPWNESPGRSKIQSTDVYDVVESPLPAIIKAFLSAKEIHRFVPNNDMNPADVQEAEEKTAYINRLIKCMPNGYQIFSAWLKEPLIKRFSVLYYDYVEEEVVEVEEYEGMSQEERIKLLLDLSRDDEAEYDVLKEEQDEDGFYLKIRIKRTKRYYDVKPIQTDNFRISRNACTKDDAEIIGHDEYVRRGDLIAQGYDEEVIDRLPAAERYQYQSVGLGMTPGVANRASDLILVSKRYVYVDYDGDGIPERRKVVYSGTELLENEQHDHAPYAINCSNLMPHEVIGKSLGQATVKTQEGKTMALRSLYDNMYQVASGRVVVNVKDNVTNVDDLLVNRHQGIIRTKGDPRMAVAPLDVPFVGNQIMSVIQYMDFARSQRTGTLMASQGLNTDALREETATRFEGVQGEGQDKVMLIIRNYAETGWRQLFEGLAWMASHYQNTREEIRVLGKELSFNPAMWRYDHKVETEIGLGSGDEVEQTDSLMSIFQIQQMLAGTGSPIVDSVKQYNTLARTLKSMGYKRTEEFFNNPEVPEQMAQQTIEDLTNKLTMAMDRIEQMNPLVEAEKVRAQADLIKAQAQAETASQSHQIDMAKLVQDQRQFIAKLEEEKRQFNAEILTKLNEIEARTGKELTNRRPNV